MQARYGVPALLSLLLAAACGGAPEPQAPASAAKPRSAKQTRASGQRGKPVVSKSGLPTACGKKRWPCMPPAKWVDALCSNVYPDVALHMFAPGTPWQRFYMLHNAEPFNASGGMSLMGDKMRRGEEVIALRRRSPGQGVQTSDIGGYDVLRWNGACATVHDGEFALRPLGSVGNARIEWRELGLPVRLMLEKDTMIAETYEERRKSCKGVSLGRVSGDCEGSDKRLVDAIVRYVRDGGKLPKPAKSP